jgi:molybdopterin-containing oxidoreductase family iron-sulfur binding subunit
MSANPSDAPAAGEAHAAHALHALEDNYEAAYGPGADTGPAVPATPEHGYWRSLAELRGEGKLQTDRSGNELPPAPAVVDPLSRRNFFQLMGASMALAGVGACRRYEKEEIVPLARRPEDLVPGEARYYATAFELGGVGHALLATSYEGRPIKLDGNPDHPFASGGIVTGTKRHAGAHPFAQAAILSCYDPDRSQTPLEGGKPTSLEAFRARLPELRGQLRGARVLAEASSSPTLHRLRAALVGAGVTWHEYEPLSWDNERAGTKLVFGRPTRPLARLDRCETIVTIDCDIFVEHPAAMRYSRDFARSRRVGGSLASGGMNRLWAAEPVLSHTGAMADHRLAIRADHGLPFAQALAAAVMGGVAPASELAKDKKVERFIAVLAEELKQNRGRAVVLAGRRQPPEVHAVVAQLNHELGAVGTTLDYLEEPEPDRASHAASIKELADAMSAGKVPLLLMLGGNPIYDAPVDCELERALGQVATSVHLHEHVNETSQKASWHLPRAHFLEAWGDSRTWDGTITIAQPIFAPLYGGLSAIELLSMLLGQEATGEALVRATIEGLEAGGWRQQVHDGFAAGTQLPAAAVELRPFSAQLTPAQAAPASNANGKLEVIFQPSSSTYDGRFANNAWLQETPDFLSKVTWDNYALVGPDTAAALGVENDTIIRVKVGGRELEIPCYTMPGQALGTIALVLGGGRTAAGRVGNGVGVDTNRVRTVAGFDISRDAEVAPTGKRYELASVQEHWDIRSGLLPAVNAKGLQKRIPEIIKVATPAELGKSTWTAAGTGMDVYWDDEHVAPPGESRGLALFREHDYKDRHRWAMAIDLSTCTGCNACMVACQAENNVPVVGRKEVMNNREMHWIRIDRYFRGPSSDPEVVHQPIGCQQCENAPCEQVCPVGATVHSDEGLNDMSYNRCIGTRYCANNCPYKVRRFNFLDWNKEWREARNKVRRLLFNPEVTVRMRGVMEKCTFCVQRIQNAKVRARAEARNGQRARPVDAPLVDGEIQTACQQACPTEAIVFGDLSDETSRVAALHRDRRAYDLIPELYTKPRNRFLARIRNPNPKLVQAPSSAASTGGHS